MNENPLLPEGSEPQANSPPPVPRARNELPGARRRGPGLLRFVYTNNPFYVVSAGLVLWGFWISFDASGETFESGALMAGLSGYTLLLAAAACFLIRYGKVWEDVRTVLLLIVLMFLAISMTFDESLATNPRVGARWFMGGLAFAIVLSEGLLAAMRLRLPVLFRMPYYLILVLFFLYPVALSPVVDKYYHPALQWGLFGFASAAGVVFLTLLPAVRRGPRYVRENGSPWRWPWYPWVLFGVLGFAVCMRTYGLCWTMHPEYDPANVFSPYFLVPFLLAVNVLLLEMGLVSRLPGVQRAALIVPAGLVALAVTGSAATADDLGFLQRFTGTLGGSPLFFALILATAFYGLATLRRVPYASTALTAALAAFSVCGPGTVDHTTLLAPWGVPLVAVAVLQLSIALRSPSAGRCLFAVCCLVGGVTLELRETAFTAHQGAIPLHLVLVAVLLVGAVFDGRLARFLQYLGATLLAVVAVVSTMGDPHLLGNPPPMALQIYPAVVVAVAIAYGYLVRNRWYGAAALCGLACWLAVVGWQAYRVLRQSVVGLDHIACGIVFFLLAIAISLTKAGAPRRWLARRRS